MIKLSLRKLMLALVVMMTAMPVFAMDYWTVGKVQAVLLGGEETSEAGFVYVANDAVEAASDIAAVQSVMQTIPFLNQGASGSSALNKEYFFYAKANEGYKFLGFASTASGTPSSAGLAENMEMIGDFYSYSAKAGAGYNANTEETPKVLTRYAVFEKVGGDEGGQGGDQGQDDPATETKVVSVTNQYGQNLIDAELKLNDGGNFSDGDMVTHIYVTFDHELAEITTMAAHKALAEAVSLVNTTTGEVLGFNQYSCGVMSKDKHMLDLFLSTENYINNKDYQGVYVVTLPAGLVTSTNGKPSEAYTFTFTYGNPDQSGDSDIVLSDYIGDYVAASTGDEIDPSPVTFKFSKIGTKYYITNLCGSDLQIPLEVNGKSYSFASTSNKKYAFSGTASDNVTAIFAVQGKQKAIYLDEFTLFNVNESSTIVGGLCYYTQADPTSISNVKVENGNSNVYDVQGRKVAAPAKGINIVNGKKFVIK